jgi:uncharacterized protein YciI
MRVSSRRENIDDADHTLDDVDFLVYSRAAPGAASAPDDPALDEEHWSYMDGFADGMVARGPTLAADRKQWTGSLHIVDLPSAEAAREFVELEPYNRAGLFEHHTICRFQNLLGRTMWESPGGPTDPRFFVIAQRAPGAGEHAPGLLLTDFAAALRERLIVHGELLTPDDARPAGVALALPMPTREAVDALLRDGRPGLDEHFELQILDWEFGGRR